MFIWHRFGLLAQTLAVSDILLTERFINWENNLQWAPGIRSSRESQNPQVSRHVSFRFPHLKADVFFFNLKKKNLDNWKNGSVNTRLRDFKVCIMI